LGTREDFVFWSDIHNDLQNIKKYDDLTKEFEIIRARVIESNILSKEDEIKLKDNVIRHWKRIINDGCRVLKRRIEQRATRGQPFLDIKIRIREIESQSEKTLRVEDYQEIWHELELIHEKIEERINIEKFHIVLFMAGIVIGFILGIVTALLF